MGYLALKNNLIPTQLQGLYLADLKKYYLTKGGGGITGIAGPPTPEQKGALSVLIASFFYRSTLAFLSV